MTRVIAFLIYLFCIGILNGNVLSTFIRPEVFHGSDLGNDEAQLKGQLYQVTEQHNSLFTRDGDSTEPFELHLVVDSDKFKMTITRAKSVVHSHCMLGIRSHGADDVTTFPANDITDTDCYVSGKVHSHDGAVVFNECGDNVNGYMTTQDHEYHIVLDREHLRRRRDVDSGLHVTVTKRAIDKHTENIIDELQDAAAQNVAPIFGGRRYGRSTGSYGRRYRRSTGSDGNAFTVEMAVYVDADYNAYMEANGLTTLAEKMDALMIKYQTSAGMFGLVGAEGLNYTITLSIKYMEIWTTNPSWYELDHTLSNSMKSVCSNVRANATNIADIYVMHTKQDQGTSRILGRATINSVCGSSNCVIENGDLFKGIVVTHEIGHALGMYHNHHDKCMDPGDDIYFDDISDGTMESHYYRWNDCNRYYLRKTVVTKQCLWEENYQSTSAITLDRRLPGQKYTADQLCELFVGSGGWFRDFPRPRHTCSIHYCVKDKNGIPVVHKSGGGTYAKGKYCADQKICILVPSSSSIPRCNTLSDAEVYNKDVIQGGWADFGPWVGCTRTCGKGVRYRKRDCTNPVPQNAPYCDGSQYEYHLCNTQACSDEPSDATDLLNTRRSNTCDALGETVKTSVSAATSGHKQCEVQCTTSIALLPYGTPCNGNGERYCLEGYCLNGYNTVWKEIIDTTVPGFNVRAPIHTIPARAQDIVVTFKYTDMLNNLMEIYTKEDVKVLSPQQQNLYDTLDNPLNFAGTYWYFKSKDTNGDQRLTIDDGTSLSEPVILKLHQNGYETNIGISISYAVPIASCSGSCTNGNWSSTLCSCDCNDGYYGPTCSSQCGIYCNNGYTVNESTCECNCDTSVTYSDYCRCQYPFVGKNCESCRIPGYTIENNCRFSCDAGCGGLECNDDCGDSSTVSFCTYKVNTGQCSTTKAEQLCQESCGYCTPSSSECIVS